MAFSKRRLNRHVLFELAFHAVVFAGAWWFARLWGPGQDGAFDSAFYVDGARHLAQGDGYVSALTEPDRSGFAPITRWAPGFSLLMAGAIAIGTPAIEAASWVLTASYAAACTLVGAIGFRVLGRRNWFGCLLAVVAFATLPATLRALDALLSDLPFATFALLALLLSIALARSREPSWTLRIGLGVCFGLIFLLRYAAALFLPSLVLATLWTMRARSRSFWLACWQLTPSCAVFALTVGAWIARNEVYGPEPFGQRASATSVLSEELSRAWFGAFSWLQQLDDPAHLGASSAAVRWLPWIALLSAFTLALLAWRPVKRSLILLCLPALGYFAAMVCAATRVHFDPIDHPRFWVATWPLCFLAVLVLALRPRRSWLTPLKLTAASLLALLVVVFAPEAVRQLDGAQIPRGLLSARWREASTVLPDPETCRLFVMDARPFMLHRELGPTSGIPLARAEFDAVAPQHAALCLATVTKRLKLSTSAERRRPQQAAVVDALVAESRVVKIAERAGVTVYRMRDAKHR
ncbi:MAG TPA: hypothetical protein VJR89_36460 [Polyangiales bacterium]|nr:hypothetical protein [Polyangiales bacterium]